MCDMETAFLDGETRYSFKAKLPNKSEALKSFTVNFESVLLVDEDDIDEYFELRRRPATVPLVYRPF